MQHHAHVCARPLSEGEPPTEFLIWAFGTIDTLKGEFELSPKDAKGVYKTWRRYGNDLSIDYEHKAVDPDARAGDGKAAGWCQLELRAGGLWAVGVRWTPKATTALKDREYRYFSPAFLTDDDSHICELINIALTNVPATRKMTPLVASRITHMEDEETEKELAIARESKRLQSRSRLARARAELEAAEAECTALSVAEEPAETDPPNATTEEQGEPVDPTNVAAVAKSAKATAAPSKAAALPGEDDEEPDGDEETDGEAEEVAAAKKCVAVAREITGKRKAAEVTGALRVLSQEITQLKTDLRRRDVAELVSRGVKSGKIAPSTREWFASQGMRDISELRSYLDVAPTLVTTSRGAAHVEPSVTANLGGEARKVAQLMGLDPTKFSEHAAKLVRTASLKGGSQ